MWRIFVVFLLCSGLFSLPVHSAGISPARQVFKLNVTDAKSTDQLGTSVGIYNSQVVVGAPGYDSSSVVDCGSVYVFTQNGTGSSWGQIAKLMEPVPSANALYGSSISFADGLLAIGSPASSVSGHVGAGRVYVYAAPSLALVANLTGSQTVGAEFGAALSVSGSCVLVGEPSAAQAWVFCRLFDATQLQYLWTLDGTMAGGSAARFGGAVALWGNIAAIGSSYTSSMGTVHVFRRLGVVRSLS